MRAQAKKIVIGTRGSALALWQTRWVLRRLRTMFPGARFEEQIIKTTGDLRQGENLATFGQKGVFTKELDEALLAGAIDLAVHSLKDLPAELPAGLELAAVPRRADPHDALITEKYPRLDALPPGARVGTGSPRRVAQLLAQRPELQCEPIRGNLDTRLRKLAEGRYDAIILAAAGLRRLGWGKRITQLIPFSLMLPAAGQGALAVVGRKGARKKFQALTDPDAWIAVQAERALLRELQGGCQLPLGALARAVKDTLRIDAALMPANSKELIRVSRIGNSAKPAALGRAAAKALLDYTN